MPACLDPSLPREQRIDDLLKRLTPDEKIGLMMHDSPAVERLGIPAYSWWNEACHGVGRNGRATVFPQVIGLAATWNRALVRRIASAIAEEARAKHHAAVAAGRRGQYQGLTFWTPNINIYRDPRWGRGQETFGEDPYLTGELGLAMVRGLQGERTDYLKTAACAKHFAVHSGPERLRHGFDAKPTPRDLAETYLPAFEKLVRGGVEAVMGAYNRVLGEAACASQLLLVDLLRGEWGFQGHVVSDCGAVDDFHLHHHVTRTGAESASLAVRRGCDLNCGNTYRHLKSALKEGLLTEADLDRSVRRLLSTRMKLGLFDPPDLVPWSQASMEKVDGPEHRELARAAAVESVVLLKNNGVLPLRPDHRGILLVGPTAANTAALLGSYYGVSPRLITILEGMAERCGEGTGLVFRSGSPLSGPMAPGVNYTYATAEENEITVACFGLDSTLEGEEGDAVASSEGGDRGEIELPRVQREMLAELRKHARKLVLVLTGGGPIAVPDAHEYCDAVLQVWYPGCEGGRAVTDVLFGAANPSGRLPVTVPKRTADLPPFEDYRMAGRTYRYAETEPLYPFGFGLSYSKVEYGGFGAAPARVAEGGNVRVSARLAHRGGPAVEETVQCYILPPPGAEGPRATLVGFQKVALAVGKTAEIAFDLPASAFARVDAKGRRALVPGRYGVVIGPCSPGSRGQSLGAPAPAAGTVDVG